MENNERFTLIDEEPEEQKSEKKILKEEFDIKVNPRKVVKGVFICVIFLLVFFAGRWSIDPPGFSFDPASLSSDSEETDFAETLKENVEEKEVKPSALAGAATTEVVEPETVEEENVELDASTEEVVEEENEDIEEEVITDYKRVAFSIDKATVDWKETWGKITHLGFTVKNNEAGTIKPDHIIMLVEGYDDFEKKINIPLSGQEIKSKNVYSTAPKIPSGFSYNEATTGDLATVKITGTLYDGSGKQMATFSGNFNLNG